MKSPRHQITFAKKALLIFALGGQIMASGAVMAHGSESQGPGDYRDDTGEGRSTPAWSGRLPAEESRDRTRFIFEDAGV